MNCPNCDHKIDDLSLSRFPLSEKKIKMSGICNQCGKLVNFVLNGDNEDTVKCYAWLNEKEKKYARYLTAISHKRYVLYVSPITNKEDIYDKLRQFFISHGDNSAFILPESLSYLCNNFSNVCSTIVLPDSLFPEDPSYIAEKLIVENIYGELFSTCRTLYNRFKII